MKAYLIEHGDAEELTRDECSPDFTPAQAASFIAARYGEPSIDAYGRDYMLAAAPTEAPAKQLARLHDEGDPCTEIFAAMVRAELKKIFDGLTTPEEYRPRGQEKRTMPTVTTEITPSGTLYLADGEPVVFVPTYNKPSRGFSMKNSTWTERECDQIIEEARALGLPTEE